MHPSKGLDAEAVGFQLLQSPTRLALRLVRIQKSGGGRNRDRTYDLCDVNAALVPTELCAPGSHPASVSAVDDTSGSGRPRKTSDPGDGLGLLPCRVLRGLEVVGSHVDAEHALAAVADQVERLRTHDLAGNRLPVPAAFACNDRSHLFSTPGPQVRTTGRELATASDRPR